MPSFIRVTRRKPPVRTHRESEQTVENHDVSPPVFSAVETDQSEDVGPVLSSRLFRAVYSKRRDSVITILSTTSSESSECSDVSMRSDLSKELIINFSRKRKLELSFGSSDSFDLSDDSLDEDWSSKSRAAPTSPGSSKTCDVLMKSDGSKGRADTDRKRRSGRCRGEKGQVKPGVRTHHRGHSQM